MRYLLYNNTNATTLKEQKRQHGVLVLPYVTEATTHKGKGAIKRYGLDVFLVQKSGPTLKSLLTWSALVPTKCPGREPCLACLAELEDKCATKNVEYRLDCVLCLECYIGETKDPFKRDWWNTEELQWLATNRTPWGAHSYKHGNTPTPDVAFKATIIKRTQNHVNRKLMEAIDMAENNLQLNIDNGWQLLPTITTRVTRRRVAYTIFFV